MCIKKVKKVSFEMTDYYRRRLSSGVGAVHPLLPHPLHHEVAGNPPDTAPVPHVQTGVEVQGVIMRKDIIPAHNIYCFIPLKLAIAYKF